MGRKSGFTLAETLITLTIIGVVAAIVMPALVTDTGRKEHLTAFKKKYVELNQVIQLSAINNGNPATWNWDLSDEDFVGKYVLPYFKDTNKCEKCWLTYSPRGMFFEQPAMAAPEPGCECIVTDKDQEACYQNDNGSNLCTNVISKCKEYTGGYSWFYGPGDWCDNAGCTLNTDLCTAYLSGAFDKVKPADEPSITYTLADGSILGFYRVKSKQVLFVYLDVNGKKKPNKFGVDKYLLTVSGNSVIPYGKGTADLTTGEYACASGGNRMYCGAMIMQNDWSFPENYPKI